MTIKTIINTLKDLGYNVSFYKRKDGGIRITRINGETFKGSSGNVKARQITGTKLTEGQQRALSKLITPKGKGSYNKRRKAPIDEETKKRIAKLQKQYRKAGKKEGKPTIRNYRYIVKTKGKKEAERLLRQSERRILGLAYTENIHALVSRINSDIVKFESRKINCDKLKEARGRITIKRESFLDRWIYPIYEILYDMEMAIIGPNEAGEKIIAIIS